MAIPLTENLEPNTPFLLDTREGPFPTTQAAKDFVGENYRAQGLFAIIADPNSPLGARLYWYKNNTTDLVPFTGNNSVVVLNTFADFPPTGDLDVIYVDKSTSTSYYWDTSLDPPAYVPTGSGAGSVEIYPKYLSGGPSDVPGVDYFPLIGVENVIYIANDTDFSYYWDPTANAGAGGYIKLTGNQGKSAYEIWLDLGNVGTEQDFIDSLKGDPGDGITINGLNYVGDWEVLGLPYTYAEGDVVYYQGSSYVRIFAGTDDVGSPTPDISPNWGLLTSKGAQGDQGPIGPDGAQGPPGPQGVPGAIGPAGLIWRGEWSPDVVYDANDAVGFGGASYFCVNPVGPSPNDPTVDTVNWALLANIGAQGIQGPAGPQGEIGPQGPQGPQGAAGVLLITITDNITGPVSIAPGTSEIFDVANGGRVLEGAIIFIDGVGYFTVLNVSGNTISASNDFSEDTLIIPDASIDFRTVLVTGPEGPGGAGAQNLQGVTDVGNTTDNDIALLDTAKVTFDNGAKLQKGTVDAGALGGIALKCSVEYELKWEAGRLYIMQQDGFEIREVRYTLTATPTTDDDNTKGFVVGSRWILDNGDTYICTDATTGIATWTLEVIGGGISYYTASGSDTYITGIITTFNTGDTYLINFTNPNTGASTLDGQTLVNSKTQSNLVSGDIRTNETHLVVYDGSVFQVLTIGPNSSLNPGGGSGGGSGAIVDMGYRMDGLELVDMGSRI
jgi:hypothetical protein